MAGGVGEAGGDTEAVPGEEGGEMVKGKWGVIDMRAPGSMLGCMFGFYVRAMYEYPDF